MYAHAQFDSPSEAVDFLNGVIMGKIPMLAQQDLTGLTLILTGTTITFNGVLTPNQVVAAINSQYGENVATIRNPGHGLGGSYLAFVKSGLIVRGTGTANPALGFAAVDTTVGAVIDRTKIVYFGDIEQGNAYALIYEL
jgi:hypothetical protein